MDCTRCHCVIPNPLEEEWVTIEGDQPGTAVRVNVLPGPGGYVRLQQLEYVQGMGWNVQKSFIIPGELLRELVPQLRKADCMIPRQSAAPVSRGVTLRLAPQEHDRGIDVAEPERRRA